MTINEHIDAWNGNRLTRISFTPDGKNEIMQTPIVGLYSAIRNYCLRNGVNIKQYYQTLEMKRSMNYDGY